MIDYNFATITENEVGPFLTNPNNLNEPLTTPYYYAPSSTVIRQQRLIKQHQQMQQQQQLMQASFRPPTNEQRNSKSRSLSKNQQSYMPEGAIKEYDTDEQDMSQSSPRGNNLNNLRHMDSVTPSPLTLNNNHQNYMNKQYPDMSNHQEYGNQYVGNDEVDEVRRSSYLNANKGKQMLDGSQQHNENLNNKNMTGAKAASSNTPQHSRNTSIKKLKNFFGEKVNYKLSDF